MTRRPETWDSYIGQDKLRRRLEYAVLSSIERGEGLPPILLHGPPGSGKTTLAKLIAGLRGHPIVETIAPIPDRLLTRIVSTHNGVLFIDEVHRTPVKDQERLLPLLEDGYIQDGRGREIHAVGLSIVAATTEGDKIIAPLYDRFRIKPPFEPYTPEQLTEIVKQMAGFEGLNVSDEWASGIAAACLGVPRNAKSLIEMARDLSVSHGTLEPVERVLTEAGVTEHGLNQNHQQYVATLMENGGLAGLSTISQLMTLPAGQIERLEVDLIRAGFLTRTPSGRELTSEGFTFAQEYLS